MELDKIKRLKNAYLKLSSSTLKERNEALLRIAEALVDAKEDIFTENGKDVEEAKKNIGEAVIKRLKFDEAKLKSSIDGIKDVVKLPDPIGKTLEKRELDDSFILERKSFPIGVICMIFEARPDALIQIVSLCLKSGNAVVLKGGKEAKRSNRAIFETIKNALDKTSLGSDFIYLIESHEEVSEILKLDKYIDLVIPRGSNSFVRYVMDNTRIPVLGHADGICSIYVDESADLNMAVRVCLDSKTQYSAACNAVETILVNRKIAKEFLPLLKKAFDESKVVIHASDDALSIIDAERADDADFNKEFLGFECALKIVDDVKSAIEHINSHGSHHTDAIITKSEENKNLFFSLVDSADVFANCSTRFADGYRFGLGAEVGISTSKIHARGPVGLSGLMSYKWLLSGNGEIVKDYADGLKSFHHKDLV